MPIAGYYPIGTSHLERQEKPVTTCGLESCGHTASGAVFSKKREQDEGEEKDRK
jgi:hypothetical protein